LPRLVKKLTALKVVNASPGWYCDGDGLWLQVTATGARTWVFRYDVGGKRRHMGLGSVRQFSLAEARSRAAELRLRLRDGADPLAEKRNEQLARRTLEARRMTFDACARAYIKAHRACWRSAKHASPNIVCHCRDASSNCSKLSTDSGQGH
jgi:hypothetical protein